MDTKTVHIEVISFHSLEINACRVNTWVGVVNVTDSMGREIRMSILKVRDFELSVDHA